MESTGSINATYESVLPLTVVLLLRNAGFEISSQERVVLLGIARRTISITDQHCKQ